MKIAILGTRGIPNHYGGFEQYAELLSVYWANLGWEVTVYNSHNHPYQGKQYKGVKIVHIYDPEYKIGTAGQFLYDLGCIINIRRQKFDVVYQLGYTSSAIFNFLLPQKSFLLTNMDGMEWKRSKYNKYVQRFLMYSEKLAVKHSRQLIADSLGVKQYLDEKYNVDAYFSAYTATIPNHFDSSGLKNYQLSAKQYHLLIARLEPENNVDMIAEAFRNGSFKKPLIIVGNHETPYGKFLKSKFANYDNIRFVGSIYKKETLDNMRHFSSLYFHGHSVGGTNPSLLEAMAAGCKIIAHGNIFNKSVLQADAWYFNDATELEELIKRSETNIESFEVFAQKNLVKIKEQYSEQYLFKELTIKIKNCLA